ncbi:MAG: hypothetical protein JNK32_09270 [Anaerolineales bacterium]|nr:hypothetical protein [Anaerolineales bacterium]
MSVIKNTFGVTWRSILVAVGYIVGLMVSGMIAVMTGVQMATSMNNESAFNWLMISSLLLGVILGPVAARLQLTRRQHFVLWGSLIFFNLGSVAIEGAYFAPELVPIPVPILFVQQALASACAAAIIVLTFAKVGTPLSSWADALRTRPWFSWLWRFLASSFSYLVFYFIFGAINYSLVTRPYYESHAGGLTAPAPEVVLMAELVRAPLIVLSILFFLLSARGTKRELMIKSGWLIFAIGGIIPLVLQISALPLFLLAASAVEIFCQNFLTGAVAAYLMGIEESPVGIKK